MALLQTHDLTAHYGDFQALFGVDIELSEAETIAIIGANGAGKTTLMRSIAGVLKNTASAVQFDGTPIGAKSADEIMSQGVAMVPEGRRVFSGLTVEENLHMGGFFNTKSEIRKSQDHVYELFPRLKEREHQRAGTMSGGEQQMLAIGRALMSKPNMIILDEPSLGLAPLVIKQIFEIIGKLREEGITVFLVEQNAHQALNLADRGYVLETGRIRLHDTGKNLLANPDVRRSFLGG